MKDWADDHPKAKLMERKRAAILKAAREGFLSQGFEGTSMEEIAAAADVSIMTLYRHAQSKNELFAAVIASACDPNDPAEQDEFERLMKKPLGEILAATGMMAQRRLSDPETVALLRTVMAEAGRFPELAEIAYRGFVGHLEGMVEYVLEGKDEAAGLSKTERAKLASGFIDSLFGSDMLRVLLGLTGVSATEQRQRAGKARDLILSAIGDAMPRGDAARRKG